MTTSEQMIPSLVLRGGKGAYYAIPLEVVQAHRVPDEQVGAITEREGGDVSGYSFGAQGSSVSGDFGGFGGLDGGITSIIGLFTLPANSFNPSFPDHPALDSTTSFNPTS